MKLRDLRVGAEYAMHRTVRPLDWEPIDGHPRAGGKRLKELERLLLTLRLDRLVLAESGIGWLPYFLARLDSEWHALRDKLDYAPAVAPSELFRRQVVATFEEEPLAAQLIPLLGAGSCMWASDYPHTDSTFPNSRQAIEESLGSLPEPDRRKITATNCARLYGFADVG